MNVLGIIVCITNNIQAIFEVFITFTNIPHVVPRALSLKSIHYVLVMSVDSVSNRVRRYGLHAINIH